MISLAENLLEVAIGHRIGPVLLDVAFATSAPWTVLFGPSGSGKTTVLRAVQGLIRPDAGRIAVGSQVVLDAGIWVAAYRRGVRSAGQTARLFPGRTVRENVGFGASGPVVLEVLELMRLEGLADSMPERLSGGERQRVSVARAVAAAASAGALLLLDEPFGGLDLGLRDELALELRGWLAGRGVPVLSVTHDVAEVFLLEAEVVRLSDGRIMDQGPAERVLRADRKRLLAHLLPKNAKTSDRI